MVDVFISYPRVERARVEVIKESLEALGLEVFFDIQGIEGGDAFPDVIDTALRNAKCVLGCWSVDAFQSRWCMIECRTGEESKHFVPVAIERFPATAPPADLKFLNYLDLTDFDGSQPHEGWSRTLRALSRHIGRDLGLEPRAANQTRKLSVSVETRSGEDSDRTPRDRRFLVKFCVASLCLSVTYALGIAIVFFSAGKDEGRAGSHSLVFASAIVSGRAFIMIGRWLAKRRSEAYFDRPTVMALCIALLAGATVFLSGDSANADVTRLEYPFAVAFFSSAFFPLIALAYIPIGWLQGMQRSRSDSV